MNISVVLPAYNEAENLPGVLANVSACMRASGGEYEVIVVDDGSKDTTRAVLGGLAQTDPRLVPIYHPHNRGYGAALRSGFSQAKKDWVFFMDSDGQFDIQDINKFIAFTDQYDLVLGFRKNRQDSFIRKLNTAIFKLAVNVLFGLWVKDIDCAFKLIKREVLNKIELEANGALINTELLVKAKRLGYKFVQVPVLHFPRTKGSPTGASLRVIARAVGEILLFRLTGRTVLKKRV